MEITAQDVNRLRLKTGAGMMDCKKALAEAQGDFEKAIEILRKKGQKVMASRADREAREGIIAAALNQDSSAGVLIELNCETDFVAKNEEFMKFAEHIAQIAAETLPPSLDDLNRAKLNGRVVAEVVMDYVGKIGEKIQVSRYEFLKCDGGKVVTYVHPGSKLGVLINIEGMTKDGWQEAGRNVAMQVAAMNPIALDRNSVSPNIIEKEIEIGKAQAKAEGKPDNVLEKIAQGKLNKFFQENTLMEQEFIKDSSKTIAKYLKEFDSNLKVTAFRRVQIGVN